MFGIRQKLMLGFGGLLAVIAVVGGLTMSQIDRLGRAIDVILRENYRSVVACQNMRESLERMDNGALFILAGKRPEGEKLIGEHAPRFRSALKVELANITLPGEGGRAAKLSALFDQYAGEIGKTVSASLSPEELKEAYFSRLQPLSDAIKDLTQEILLINQANMSRANSDARRLADIAHRRMLMAIGVSALVSLLFSLLIQRWILQPLLRLIESVREISRGNLNLVLGAQSKDEIGQLSASFNEMAAVLRRVRAKDTDRLIRTRRATEDVFKALPTVVVLLDLEGYVDAATATAESQFGFRPGILAAGLGYEWLQPLVSAAKAEGRTVERNLSEGYVQRFVGGREHFFQPMAVPVPSGSECQGVTGVALILQDVTQLHEQRELKRDAVSTLSHQLKTPLTSLRMCVHLLLEERIGPLNEKQSDLLVTAREDSERLVRIIDDLLDLKRVESGRARMALKRVSPHVLVREAVEPFLVEARDKGVSLGWKVRDDLPEVMADAEKIRHVFANLLSNALRFTGPGGSVTVDAARDADTVVLAVRDTGVGIAPEHLDHLFAPFYRVPGQDEKSGVGLGLAIVKEIVQAHGGEVSVESQPGNGSVFRFTLPVAVEGES